MYTHTPRAVALLNDERDGPKQILVLLHSPSLLSNWTGYIAMRGMRERVAFFAL